MNLDDEYLTHVMETQKQNAIDQADLAELILAAPMRYANDALFHARVVLVARMLEVKVEGHPVISEDAALYAAMRIIATREWLDERLKEWKR